ncbi:MAG: DUF3109 family protein [Ignavibacteria bacterium]|jgi:hypothetical protein
MNRNLLEIDGILINKEITEIKFTCDLDVCKGACCTMESEFGAPLKAEEVKKIKKILPVIKEYLSEKSIKIIEKYGFYDERHGELMTSSIGNRDCVFVYYESSIARCAIEKAYFEGKVKFRKPISCHLFPIRVSNFGGEILRYEKYKDCDCALEKGMETQLSIGEFCSDALEREFGKKITKQLAEINGK